MPIQRAANLGLVCAAVVGLGFGGCAVVPSPGGGSQSSGQRQEPKFGPGNVTYSTVQAEVLDIYDKMLVRVGEATATTVRRSSDPQVRADMAAYRFAIAHGALLIISAPNPITSMLDLMVMFRLQRIYLELNGHLQFTPAESDPLIVAISKLEDDVWSLGERALTPEQLSELNALIDAYVARHPDELLVTHFRLDEFADQRLTTRTPERQGGRSVFSLLMLDPLANLDPTVRELTQSRQLAERIFRILERGPVVLAWLVQNLSNSLMLKPEIQQLFADVDQMSDMMQEYALQINEITEMIPLEREAAIAQVLEGVRAEREAFMDDLRAEDERLRGTLVEARETLDAATALSESAGETVRAADALVTGFFGTLDKRAERAGPDAPPKRPFDITEYTAAAAAAGETSKELNTLVASLSSTLESPALTQRLDELEGRIAAAEASGDRLINAAFRKALILAIVLIVGAAGVVVLARVIRARA